MKDGAIKLGDLNVSKVCHGEGLMFTQTGTPYYASPEVWKDKPYDSKSDIWSLGCVLYEMTTLNPPFKAKDMKSLYKKVIKGIYPEIPKHYSHDLRATIAMCLRVCPTARPSAEQLLRTRELNKKARFYDYDVENDENINTENRQDHLLDTIRISNKFKNIRLPKPKYVESKTSKRSHSYECSHNRGQILQPKERKNTVETKRRINTSKLTLLK